MMKHLLFKIALATAALACLLPLRLSAQANAFAREYTEEHPLIYEDAWDLWPYAYLNEQGKAEGYNIDLVKRLCEEMDIPVKIVLKSTQEAVKDLMEGRSDLMLGLENRYKDSDLRCNQSVILLFTHSVVYPKSLAQNVKDLADLAKHVVIVHQGSFSHNLMQVNGWGHNAIAIEDMKAAIRKVSAEGKGQIVWNTMSLKWLLRKFQIENLAIGSVDMPHGEYKFMSRDTMLLANIDKAYKKIGASRKDLEALQNRWFYPEQADSGIPSWIWDVTGAVAVAGIFFLFFFVLYHRQANTMTSASLRSTRLLAQILQMSNMQIWTYDLATKTFAWLDAKGLAKRTNTQLEFSQHFTPDDFSRLNEGLRQVSTMEKNRVTMELKATGTSDEDNSEHEFSVVLSVLRWNNDKPAIILGTMNDVTADHTRKKEATTLLMRYRSIFASAMVDMIYFNPQGYITNMNKRALRTFHITKEEAIKMNVHMRDFLGDINLDLNTFERFHMTRALSDFNLLMPTEELGKAKYYYELQMVPVRDKDHHLLGIYATGMDVTEFVKNWHQQKESIKKLKKANEEVEDYVKNIDYVMKVGGVRTIKYSPVTHTLTIYNETDVVQHTLTQSRCMLLVAEQSKNRALRLLDQMDNLSPNVIEAEIVSKIQRGGHPIYLQINFVPTFDEEGRIECYFGIIRNVTDIKITELQLEKETARAKEVEVLKNSFLRNMSYEIRTPLNTVVGFAELFEMEHQPEDEAVFSNEIKENASILLRLINDILFLSRLDAHMIEINKQPTDFAKTFEAHCHNGWGSNQKEGVRYITNNHYEQLVVNIDDANLGLIINQLTANAAQHTTSGIVRARYDYFDGKLIIIIEDSGCGMSKDALTHIYERFNSSSSRGTGLGLPICKELAEQMGGHIDISSKVGKGTTIWVVMPCEATAIEHKIEEN